MDMSTYSIKDLEKLSGIKAHTIRIWEQRYQFLQPTRTVTNIRTYSSDELRTILNVSLLNKHGFKISHIDKMSTGEMEEKILSLTQLDAQKERVINTLIKEMISLNMHAFEKQLDIYIEQRGVEKTITEIIFSFLERVGILWMTNHINPSHEHLVINIIRQKIILGIERLPRIATTSKRVVLFMPEGEFHEIGLLFVHFLLKQLGVQVDYLGTNMPITNLNYYTSLKNPDCIFSHITAPSKVFKLEKFLEQLGQIKGKIPIVLSGQLLHSYKGPLASNIQIKKSLADTLHFLESI